MSIDHEAVNLSILRLHLMEQMGLVQVVCRHDGSWQPVLFEGEALWVREDAGTQRFYIWRDRQWTQVTPASAPRLVRQTIPIAAL